jgi:hypothetical protein
MNHLHIFTEEPSASIFFDAVLPKVLPEGVTYSVYPHQGKQDLEQAIKTTVPSISRIPGSKILITRDQDSGDCKPVKQKIVDSIKDNCHAPYLVRIFCRELEAWYLGDLKAVKAAYPRFNPKLFEGKKEFRNVDDIQTPNQYLLSILPEYKGREYLPKLETSEKIAPNLDIDANTSTSFQHLISGIQKLVTEPEPEAVDESNPDETQAPS